MKKIFGFIILLNLFSIPLSYGMDAQNPRGSSPQNRSHTAPPRIAPGAEQEQGGNGVRTIFQHLWQNTYCAGADNIIHELDKRNDRFAHEEDTRRRICDDAVN